MFQSKLPGTPDLLRRFTQEDMLASGIRVGLSVAGPVGTILGEFLTQFVPTQRIDRLQEFAEQLAERMSGLEERFNERLSSSPGYAALVEQGSLAAVRTASSDERKDLAAIIHHGLSRSDAEMTQEAALLSLRQQINDAQVLILMSHGNFRRTLTDDELAEFRRTHPGVFDVDPPTFGGSDDDSRRWTMHQHFESQLEALGLLHDTEGTIRSGRTPKYAITDLGRLLLASIGRYSDPDERDAR